MRRVILESPFGADPNRFIPYARAAVADSLGLGEAPMAMHLLYTQPGILKDHIPAERIKGMTASFAWYEVAEAIVVYRDFGISTGMQTGIDLGVGYGLPIEYRTLRDKGNISLDTLNPYPASATLRHRARGVDEKDWVY